MTADMDTDFINLTPENLSGEHLCCIIRSKKIHPGIEAKRQWLASRLTEGHVFRKLNAKAKGKSGVCMLGAQKQKAWLSDQSFAKKFGFEVVDTTDTGYELLALSFDGTKPQFSPSVKNQGTEGKGLTVYYDMQCPYVCQNIEAIKKYCETNHVPVSLIQVDTLHKAKELPCVFNNWAVFYNGNFVTVNLFLDVSYIEKIVNRYATT